MSYAWPTNSDRQRLQWKSACLKEPRASLMSRAAPLSMLSFSKRVVGTNLGFPSQNPCLTDGTRRFSNTLKKAWPHKAWGMQFLVTRLVSFASLCCLPGREANTGVLASDKQVLAHLLFLIFRTEKWYVALQQTTHTTSYLGSLCLSVLVSEMEVITAPVSNGRCDEWWDDPR